jgi:hypothetical protein
MNEITVQRGSEIGSHLLHGATCTGRGSSARAGGEASLAGGSSHENSAGGAVRPAGSFPNGALPPWDDATIEQVRAWAADGVSQRRIAQRLCVAQFTVATRMRKLGIATKIHKPNNLEMERGAAVLVQHWATMPDIRDVLRLYHAARGHTRTTVKGMRMHARKLGLVRPAEAELCGALLGARIYREQCDAANIEAAPRVQAAFDRGLTIHAATRELGMSPKRLRRMVRMGLVTAPAPQPRAAAQPKPPKPPKLAKVKPPKPVPAPRPKKLPKSWVRVAPPPPPPKPKFQTVEEWLAAGGQITRLPAAAVHATTATLGEGRELIRQHAEVMATDDGNWIARAKRKMGRFHFGAGQ